MLKLVKYLKKDADYGSITVLDVCLSENGGDLRIGPLICLARALLQSSRIVCVEEAALSDNMSSESSTHRVGLRVRFAVLYSSLLDVMFIFRCQVLKQECKQATILSVANRMGSVQDLSLFYDKLIVPLPFLSYFCP